MAIIDTALVSNGNLLIQLDDGTVVNAGRVAGPQGPPGRDGQDGAPGIPGAKGDPGENGAKWHTGVGSPEIGLGENGDLYMDVASALLPIWQKVNGDWLFLANLKPTPQFTGGGGGAAGGGGSVIIYPGPTPPPTDNDGNQINEGDLWVDINDNTLYVYYNGVWSEVTTCSVPGGGGTEDGEFLKRYGDNVDDATAPAMYTWNKEVDFISPDMVRLIGENNAIIFSERQVTVESEDDLYLGYRNRFDLFFGGAEQLFGTSDGLQLPYDIEDTTVEKHIVDKKYVDGLFDFSQYDELT